MPRFSLRWISRRRAFAIGHERRKHGIEGEAISQDAEDANRRNNKSPKELRALRKPQKQFSWILGCCGQRKGKMCLNRFILHFRHSLHLILMNGLSPRYQLFATIQRNHE